VEKVQCERVEMKPERGGKMEKGKGKKKKSPASMQRLSGTASEELESREIEG